MIFSAFKGFFLSLKASAYELKKVTSLAVSGMLLAMRSVLGMVTVLVVPTVKLGFSFFPTAISAMLYGPFVSAVVGSLGDILSYLLNPVGGAYFPGFTINGILIGMIYGAFFYRRTVTFKRALICELTITIFVELLLSSFWLMIMLGKAFFVIMYGRLLKCALMLPITVFLDMLAGRFAKKVKAHQF